MLFFVVVVAAAACFIFVVVCFVLFSSNSYFFVAVVVWFGFVSNPCNNATATGSLSSTSINSTHLKNIKKINQ